MITRFSKRTVHHEASIYVHSTHVSTQYTIISIHQKSYTSFSSIPSLMACFWAALKSNGNRTSFRTLQKGNVSDKYLCTINSLEILFIHITTELVAWEITKSLTMSYNNYVQSIMSHEVHKQHKYCQFVSSMRQRISIILTFYLWGCTFKLQ